MFHFLRYASYAAVYFCDFSFFLDILSNPCSTLISVLLLERLYQRNVLLLRIVLGETLIDDLLPRLALGLALLCLKSVL
jgi:hypothetical protein